MRNSAGIGRNPRFFYVRRARDAEALLQSSNNDRPRRRGRFLYMCVTCDFDVKSSCRRARRRALSDDLCIDVLHVSSPRWCMQELEVAGKKCLI